MNATFASRLEAFGDAVAVRLADGATLSYRALAQAADHLAEGLGPPQTVALIQCRNRLPSLLAYLACLRRQRVALLVDADLPPAWRIALLDRFQAAVEIDPEGQIQRHADRPQRTRPDLALLLPTSGSTGAPKQVMLSHDNLEANARAIAGYLPLGPEDRAMTLLPLHYSYGLSVINTHFYVGASLTLTEASLVTRAFWDLFRRDAITSLSNVPHGYEMLRRLRFERMTLPSLRYLTQAGGRLPPEQARFFAEEAARRGISFFIMYGQTEAAPRIAWLPPEQVLEHGDCIGQAIPEGELWLRDPETGATIAAAETEGELMYRGPNVMLGYAETAADLADDRRLTELATGDLAVRTAAGFYRLTGRLRRLIKLSGYRFHLDDLEARLRQAGFAALCTGRDERLAVGCLPGSAPEAVLSFLHQTLHIHPSRCQVRLLPEPPLTAAGKIDYAALLEGSDG